MASPEAVMQALWRAARITQTYRELPTGLRRAHLYVLHALKALGGQARPTDISAHALVAMPNLSKLLQEAESAGWVSRTDAARDRRSSLVSLTSEGEDCLQQYYGNYVRSIGAELRLDERPEFDEMIRMIDEAVAAVTRVSEQVSKEEPGSIRLNHSPGHENEVLPVASADSVVNLGADHHPRDLGGGDEPADEADEREDDEPGIEGGIDVAGVLR